MVRKAGLLKQLGDAAKDFGEGARLNYGIGGEDARRARDRARELQGKTAEGPKIELMAAAHPLIQRIRQLAGVADPEALQAQKEMGMALQKDRSPAFQAGQIVGDVGADLTQDTTRRFYWLLNALQASGEVINELTL